MLFTHYNRFNQTSSIHNIKGFGNFEKKSTIDKQPIGSSESIKEKQVNADKADQDYKQSNLKKDSPEDKSEPSSDQNNNESDNNSNKKNDSTILFHRFTLFNP